MVAGHQVIVIGAGQGGLSTSFCLTGHGVDHVVLERGVVADSWTRRRWDSFCLVTPNWSIRLPGAEYDGPDPDGFLPRADFVNYMERWTVAFGCPLRTGITVARVGPAEDGEFSVDTDVGPMWAPVVVIATGTMQDPRRPSFAEHLSKRIRQLDAEKYRTAGALPEGAVLVVGSGQTGCQVVDDLRIGGRHVLLSVGEAGRLPRRYRGQDCVSWQRDKGLLDRTPGMLESPAHRFRSDPHLTGRGGGRTISLHHFHRDGVRLLGMVAGVEGETVSFMDDLRHNMSDADDFATKFYVDVDAFIDNNRIDARPPTDEELSGGPPSEDWSVPRTDSIDLAAEGVSSVVWATGFSFDFGWVDFPVVDDMGYPVNRPRRHHRARPLLHGPQLDGQAEVGNPLRRWRRCPPCGGPHRRPPGPTPLIGEISHGRHGHSYRH